MKLKAIPFLLALLLACGAARAQDTDESSPVKVTITKYPDHSYSAMKTDPDAHSAENSTYNSQGKLMQTTFFDLDEQGKAVSGAVYSPKGEQPKGTLLYKTKYIYDSMNRVGEVDNYTPTDQLLSRQVYHYDSTGKVLKVETFDASGKLINTNSSSAALPQ